MPIAKPRWIGCVWPANAARRPPPPVFTLVLNLVLLTFACGLPRSRLVPDPVSAAAVLIEANDRSYEWLQLGRGGELLALQLGQRVHGGGPALRVFHTRPLRLLWQAETSSTGLSPSGRQLITVDHRSKRPEIAVELRNTHDGEIYKRLNIGKEGSCAFVSRNELACGLGGKRFGIFEIETGRRIAEGTASGKVKLIAGTLDGKLLAVAQENELKDEPPCGPPARNKESTITIYDRETRRTRCVLSTNTYLWWGDGSLSFSADGKYLLYPQAAQAVPSYEGVVDTATCQLLLRAEDCGFSGFANSDRYLLSQRNGGSFYDMTTRAWAGSVKVTGKHEHVVVDIPSRSWASYSVIASGDTRYRRLRALRSVTLPRSIVRGSRQPPATAGRPGAGFRWVSCDSETDRPKLNAITGKPVATSATASDTCELRVAAAPTGLAISLKNISSGSLKVDWLHSHVVRDGGARIRIWPSCRSPCSQCVGLRFPTEIPRQAVFTDFVTLHGTEGPGKECEEGFSAPPFLSDRCGASLLVRVSVRRPGAKHPTVCERKVRIPCNEQAAPVDSP